MRDDFNQTTKDRLARRVGWRCSDPGCRRLTCGPHSQPDRTVSIGVAAHITAAAPGGPRYDHTLTAEIRTSIANGIWLCQDCAKLIDSDTERYGVESLKAWKIAAETAVRQELEGQHSLRHDGPELVDKIDELVVASQRNADQVEALKALLRRYTNRLIDNLTPASAPAVASDIVKMIPLDNGYWLHPDDVAAEGLCTCERNYCVDSERKVYCVFAKALSDWVKRKGLYWKCYDEIVACPRCGQKHRRGHVGKLGECRAPYQNQHDQHD